MYSHSVIVESLFSIPYCDQITHLELREHSVRFNWRGERYDVSELGRVAVIEGPMERGTNGAILMEHILKPVLSEIINRRA